MRKPVTPAGMDKQRGVTMGWFFEDHATLGRILRHAGEVDGHSAMLWLALQVDTGIIVLANVGSDTAPRLTQEISKVVVEYVP